MCDSLSSIHLQCRFYTIKLYAHYRHCAIVYICKPYSTCRCSRVYLVLTCIPCDNVPHIRHICPIGHQAELLGIGIYAYIYIYISYIALDNSITIDRSCD